MSLITDRIQYYQDRLAVQYRTMAKARATIGITASQLIADGLIDQIDAAFDLDTATGAQLDIIGQYVGLPRNIGLPVSQPFFGFWDNTQSDPALQNPNGFTDTTDPSVNAKSIFYDSTSFGNRNTDLSDDQYRWMINLKIVLNSNDGTLYSIASLLHSILPGAVTVKDNKNMTLTYTLVRNIPVDPLVVKSYLPRPMCVALIFLYLEVTAAPTPVSHTDYTAGGIDAPVSPSVTVSIPTAGTGPYSYQWTKLSESNLLEYSTIADSPNSATTTFHRTFNGYGTSTSVWVCVVTDANGLIAQTNQVTVTLATASPP